MKEYREVKLENKLLKVLTYTNKRAKVWLDKLKRKVHGDDHAFHIEDRLRFEKDCEAMLTQQW